MSDISKIKVSGVEYDIKDIQARGDLGNLGTRVTELEQHGGGSGGASSADVFIIHGTPGDTNQNAHFDKTIEQISEAYQSGKYCLVCFNGMFLPVVSVETYNEGTDVICGGVTLSHGGQGHIIMALFATTDGVTWSKEKPPMPVMYDVYFERLKIFNQNGIPYTISVDADGNITATRT